VSTPTLTKAREVHRATGGYVSASGADAAQRVKQSDAEEVRLQSTEAADVGARVAPGVRLAVVAALITGAWAAALWMSPHVQVGATLRSVALFAHLGALILGLGAVLAIDWCALLWLVGRRSLPDVLKLASGSHPIIWLGLAILTASGALLSPDLSAVRTQIKLGLVLAVALNGIQTHAIQRRLEQRADAPPVRLLIRSVLTATLSQACWWTATVIGFLTHQAH
jgi:hypothetical protein